MALGETAQLLVRLDLQDNLTGPSTVALANVETQAEKTGLSVERLHTRFREFGRAGSEIAAVASVAGDAFGVAGGEAIRLAADVGLVTTAFADLGPAALGATAKLLGMKDAFDAEAAAAINARAASLGFVVGIAGIALAGVGGAVALEQYSEGQDKAQASTRAAARAQEEANAILSLYPNLANLGRTATDGLTGAMHDLDGAQGLVKDGLSGIAGILSENSRFFHQFTDDAKETGAGLDQVTIKANSVGAAIDNLPTSHPIDVPINVHMVGAASFAQDVLGSPLGYAQPNQAGASQLISDLKAADAAAAQAAADAKSKADAAARARQQALEEAARKAAQAEAERQRQIAAAIKDRYQTAKQLEDEYFAKVHQNNLRAIQDEHDKAKAQHDAAIAAINDALQTQLALNAQPVTAAQAALTNVQNQETLRNLQEAANAAFTAAQQNPNDAQAQIALRDAREALANFKAQLNINELQQKQAIADAKAKHDADVATQKADAILAAADAKAKHDTVVENGRYATQQRNFNNAMQRILDDTVKKHQSLNTALQRLIDLIDRYAGKPLPTKDGQTGKAGESIHVVNVNVPPITIGARAVSNAMSTQINPSQTPFVRSGQVRPKFSPGN